MADSFMSLTFAALTVPPVDPVAFRLGPVAVRWYGIAYLASFLFGYWSLMRMSRSGRLRFAPKGVADLVGWLALGVIAGGRVGWWVFYSGGYGAFDAWYEPLAVWRGGMSFHGGVLGVAVALFTWTRVKSVDFWNVADAVALLVPAGLFLGRVANFINGELVGRETSVPWGVLFPGYATPRHPSQIYEALLEGPLLLVVLWTAAKQRRWPDGFLSALFLLGYGVLRFAVEFTREPDADLGSSPSAHSRWGSS